MFALSNRKNDIMLKKLTINKFRKFIPKGNDLVCWVYQPTDWTSYHFRMPYYSVDSARMDFYWIVATSHPTEWIRDYALKCLRTFIIKKTTNYYVSRY